MATVKQELGKRAGRARETRQRMLGAAYELFCERGFQPASMAAIAERAGVAVQTVHFTFHTKGRLLNEVLRVYAAGEPEPKPVMERPWMMEALSTRDPRRTLALVMEYGTDIYARVAPLEPAVLAATFVDPEVADAWSAAKQGRRRGMQQIIEAIASRGGLAPGLTVTRATDIHFTVHSHEVFLGLTAGCGWTVAEYKAWQYENLCHHLLAENSLQRRRRAARGLSFEPLVGQGD